MKSAPISRAASLTAVVKAGGGMTFPAVPCIGSMMTAATGPDGCARSALRAKSAQASPQVSSFSPKGHR